MKEKSVEKLKNKVKYIRSIKFKMVLLVFLSVYISLVALVTVAFISIKKCVGSMVESYAYDVAAAYGEMAERAMTDYDKETDAEFFENIFKNKKISYAKTSSYIYVVDFEGIMLYHPTADKIGSQVENEVVAGLVKRLNSGEKVESGVSTYMYRGTKKYAGYYISDTGSFIAIAGADETEIMSAINVVRNTILGMALFAVIVCCIDAYIVSLFIVKPLTRVVSIVNDIAEMDFRDKQEFEKLDKRLDEVGSISRAVNGLRRELVKIVEVLGKESTRLYKESDELAERTAHVSGITGEVGRAVDEIATGAGSQAEETQNATEQVVLIGQMIEKTNNEVTNLNENTDAMKQAGEKAQETLKELDDINTKAREAIEVIYRQTNNTNESARKIKEATALIMSIAEETNLLSLNASIEAARAGEQGKGFAVVAGQIQKLAEQSNESSQDIAEIVETLIDDAMKAVETMEQVKKIIEMQNEDVLRTNRMFDEVSLGINRSIDNVMEIAESSQKLDEARSGMIDELQSLSAIAEENAAGTQETSASVTEINNIMEQVAESSKKLKAIANVLEEKMNVFITE